MKVDFDKTTLTVAVISLILACASWIRADIKQKEAETARQETYEMSDSFQEYIEYVMVQRGCDE